jgi:hypothetical protein
MRAVVPEPGIPRVSRGTKEPVEAALLAASGAARPRRLPAGALLALLPAMLRSAP